MQNNSATLHFLGCNFRVADLKINSQIFRLCLRRIKKCDLDSLKLKMSLEIQEFFKYPFCTAVNHWTSSIIRSSVLIKWFIRSTDIFMIYLVIYTNYLHTLAELQGASTDFAMVPPPSSSPPIPKKSLNQSYNWKWQLKLNLPF